MTFRCPRKIVPPLTLLMLVATSSTAWSYIAVESPLSKIYATADSVYVARVKAVDPDNHRLILQIERLLRENRKNLPANSPAPKDDFAIQIDDPKELLAQVKAGAPVVALNAGKAAMIHLGDTWLTAVQATPRVWRVSGRHPVPSSFPGRTVAFIPALEAFQKGSLPGKSKGRDSYTPAQLEAMGNPLLDMFEHSNWKGSYSLGQMGFPAIHLVVADVDGDKKADLLAISARGVHFYRGAGPKSAFSDATKSWGLEGIKGSKAAFGDVRGNGKPCLLLDGTLWINEGARFVQSKDALPAPPAEKLLAVALADINADGRPDALLLTETGRLFMYENPGKPNIPWVAQKPRQLWSEKASPLAAHFGNWGDTGKLHVLVIDTNDVTRYALHEDGGPPADYTRLTGRPREARYFPIKDYAASAPIDLNGGDGRLDLFISTRTGKPRDLCLMNRGYGAFWPNNEAGLGKLLAKKKSASALAAADMYGDGSWELLIWTSTGELIQLDSPPYKKGKPAD